MKNEKLSLVFFGSGPVAAESLRLLGEVFTIEAVITKPTTRREMGEVSPNTPLFTVNDRPSLDRLFIEHKFSSKVGVLIDFGIIISQQVIDYFPYGIVNSHFSLLPELRGADPISFAILEGKEKTGVSLMLLVQAMDEGPILLMRDIVLDGTETATTLTSKLVDLSASMLAETLPDYVDGDIRLLDQESIINKQGIKPTYTRKLKKSDGVIDWNKSASTIEKEVRAFIEWPKSHASLGSVDVIITKAYAVPSKSPGVRPGTIELLPEINSLSVSCGEGSLYIQALKPNGKKEMSVGSFLAGYRERLNI